MIPALLSTVIFIILSALFSASEVSLFSIPRSEIPLFDTDRKSDRRVKQLLEQGEKTLIAILLGNIFVNIMIISSIDTLISSSGKSSPLLFFIVSTGVLLVFGEIFPKAVALKLGKKVIINTAPLIILIQKILSPFISVFSKINRVLLRWNYYFVLSSPLPYITNDEYLSALKRAAKKGDVSKEATEFLHEMIDIMDFPISRVVIHRSFLTKESSGYTITYNKSNEVVAILDCQTNSSIENPVWLSGSRTVGDLIHHFRSSESSVVAIHDEYGDFYGIATKESIFNYLNSLYKDRPESKNTITVFGHEPVVQYLNWFDEDLLDQFAGIQSVGGILAALHESIPSKGTILESESYIFEVLEAESSSVTKVKITRR